MLSYGRRGVKPDERSQIDGAFMNTIGYFIVKLNRMQENEQTSSDPQELVFAKEDGRALMMLQDLIALAEDLKKLNLAAVNNSTSKSIFDLEEASELANAALRQIKVLKHRLYHRLNRRVWNFARPGTNEVLERSFLLLG